MARYANGMPETFGKRQRQDVKAKKAAAREERRIQRSQRNADRAAGLVEPGTPIEPTEPSALGLPDDVDPQQGSKAPA